MFLRNHKYISGFVFASLLFGAAAYAGGSTNTPETGYTLCFNVKTRVVTLPGDETCKKGTQKFELAGKRQFNSIANSESAPTSSDEYTDDQASEDEFDNACLGDESGECSSRSSFITYTKMLLDISSKTGKKYRLINCKFQKLSSADPAFKYSSDGYSHLCSTSPGLGAIKVISSSSSQVNSYMANLKATKCASHGNVLVGYVKTQPNVVIQMNAPLKGVFDNFISSTGITTVCPVI